MGNRKFLGVLVFLLVGIVGLMLTDRDADETALAYVPPSKPNAPSTIFFPFIARTGFVMPAPLWRFGVDQARRPIGAYDAGDVGYLRLGWYVNFGSVATASLPYTMEHVAIVRVKQWKVDAQGNPTLCCVGCAYLSPAAYDLSPDLATIQYLAENNPGKVWIVGNEIERIDWSGTGGTCMRQDEILPEVYAQAYKEVYTAIKAKDPTAQVSMGSLVQPTPLRIKYLDRVWAAYKTQNSGATMPVDIWNIHVYVYQELKGSWGADIPAGLTETVGSLYTLQDSKDFTKAAQLIVGWRTWMKDNGQQQKPLITPEYGVAFPEWLDPVAFSPTRIRDDYMYPSFNYFLNQKDATLGFAADENRLIQRWAWWSLDYDDGECDAGDGKFYMDNSGNLFYSGLGPTYPPTNCPYPAQGRGPFYDYWVQYVQQLPAGASQPYVYTPSMPSLAALPATKSTAAVKYATGSSRCSSSAAARAQFFRALPDRNTPEGRAAWVSAYSKMTAGTLICPP